MVNLMGLMQLIAANNFIQKMHAQYAPILMWEGKNVRCVIVNYSDRSASAGQILLIF